MITVILIIIQHNGIIRFVVVVVVVHNSLNRRYMLPQTINVVWRETILHLISLQQFWTCFYYALIS